MLIVAAAVCEWVPAMGKPESVWYIVGFNSREGGILGSREILAAGNFRKIFIFPGKFPS